MAEFLPNPVIEAYKRDVDVSLILENLRLTPHERLEKLVELQEFAEQLRRAGRRQREGQSQEVKR